MVRSRLADFVALVATSLIAIAATACGGADKKYATGVVHYSENARRAYEDAMVAFKARDWQDATKQLREVRRRFSFSPFAPLAQLRLADVEFEQEKWVESISMYKAFVRENPKHVDTAWARMRVARGYYNQVSDAILLPAQEERDQSAVVEASREIQSYLGEFPEGPEAAQMRELGGDALARLVAHELYVARFYMRKDKLDAALARATYAVTKFAGSTRDAEARIVQGEVLLMLKRAHEARGVFESILRAYPNDPRVVQARKFLSEMDAHGQGLSVK